jgi:ATP phosphoribosyltransferase
MSVVKLALPKGRLMAETSTLLDAACWGLKEYSQSTRSYRLTCEKFPDLQAKIFNERDIPVQVAVGNYDLGICGLDWVEELTAKYPSSAIIRLRDLGFGAGAIYAVAAGNGGPLLMDAIRGKQETVRLVSEYPNLAEAFALRLRLKKFSVFPVSGAAEVYPPESADLALMPAAESDIPFNHGLTAVSTVMRFNACLIANRLRWQSHDLSEVLASLNGAIGSGLEFQGASEARSPGADTPGSLSVSGFSPDTVRLALPDGHQQSHAVGLLRLAGINISDYPSSTGNRRPVAEDIPGVAVKVIRPQDMPMQVAAGNFDLAITGSDWLRDHLYQFPSSPVKELLDLRFARVRIVAVVCNNVPASNGFELRNLWASRAEPVRIAAEYTSIADKYARDHHFGRYRVIPTWGATEAFLPEDADLLIDNTETGRTIARHNLKIIDTLFESTGLLIGNPASIEASPGKRGTFAYVTETLRKAVEGK